MSELLPPGPVELRAVGGTDTLEALERVRGRHGDLVRLKRPRGEVWLVAGPGMARAVLADRPQDFGKGPPTRRGRGLHAVLGGGLLTAGSERERLGRRRLLQPAFTRERVDALTPAVAASVAGRLGRWSPPGSQGTAAWTVLDVYPEMEALAGETLQRLLFGRPLEAGAARRLRLPLATGVASPAAARRARAEVHAVVQQEIARRAGRPLPGAVEDVLGLLLAGQQAGEIDEQGVRDEMATLVLAGMETTASATAFALALVARAPRAQRALADEVDRVLQGGLPTAADLRRLPAVDAAVAEALRLFPPIPSAPRRALRDSLLGGYLVPAGTRLLVSIHALHRHPEHWRAPTVFRPERFANDGARMRAAYLPFGSGGHFCLGRDLALLQARVVVALAVQRLRLAAVEGEELGRRLAVGLTPDGGTRLRLRPRAAGGSRAGM